MMADASTLPDAGKTESGADKTGGTGGIATETMGRAEGDEDFYLSDVDKRIVKIRPMATPIDQISRYAKSSSCNSFEVKYYSVGTREIKCSTNKKVEAMTNGASVSLPVDDLNMFTLDDTIRVVGVKAKTKSDGTAYTDDDSNIPDLVLCVCGKDSTTNLPTVYAVNGSIDSSTKQPILVPEIPSGTTLVRMGKACGELDVQTGRFNNIPMPEVQYCQNFMIQVEQSTFDKIAAKEVNWNFSDIEEDGVYDMRLAMENTSAKSSTSPTPLRLPRFLSICSRGILFSIPLRQTATSAAMMLSAPYRRSTSSPAARKAFSTEYPACSPAAADRIRSRN